MSPSRFLPQCPSVLLLRVVLLAGCGVMAVLYACWPLGTVVEVGLVAGLGLSPLMLRYLAPRWGVNMGVARRCGVGADLLLVSLLNVVALVERGVPLYFPLYIVVYLSVVPVLGWRGVLGSASLAVAVLLGGGLVVAGPRLFYCLCAAALTVAWAPVVVFFASWPQLSAGPTFSQRRRDHETSILEA